MNPSTDRVTHSSSDRETVPCPVCEGARAVVCHIGSDHLHGCPGEFQIVRCCHCGHCYTNPRPVPAQISAFYPDTYSPYHLHGADAETSASRCPPSRMKHAFQRIPGLRKLIHRAIDSRAEFIPSVDAQRPRALEIGCADGQFLLRLQENGWDVQGMELSELAGAAALRRGVNVRIGPLESAHWPECHFDAVFAWMVLEHLHEPQLALRKIYRALKPSGWFIFSIPNYGCWEPKVFGRYWHAFDLPRHLQHFRPDTVRRLLETCGFEIRQIIHQRSLLNVTGSLGLYLRERVPRWKLGERLLRFTDNPTAPGLLALAPLARLLAALGQAGRLTIVAAPRLRGQPDEGPR